MVSIIKRFLRGSPQPPAADPFALTSGAQRAVDTRLLLNAQRFYAGLSRSDRLDLFESIYRTMPLAVGAVNVIVKMVNSRPRFNSGNPQVDQRCREIWTAYRLHQANDSLVRQSLVYGYSIGEIVWGEREALTLDRVVVPPSYQIRVMANEYGQRTGYVQLPDSQAGRPTDSRRIIPPAKVVPLVRDATDLTDYYGSSLFESAVGQFEALCQILRAQINVMNRLGKPRFQVSIPTEGLTEEQFRDRLNKARAVFSQLADGTDLFAPVGVDVKVIGGETLGIKVADETRLVVSMVLAAVGIPPALLHVVITGSVGTESYARQSILVMQSMLDNIQEATAAAWNTSFWPLVQRLEGLPVLPAMSFEKPRLLEQQIEEQARQLRWDNDVREVVAGIRPAEWLAQRCGADEPDDAAALDDFVERQRSQPEPQSDKPDAAKSQSTTKGTDATASNNKAL